MTTHEQIQEWIAVYRDLDEETRQRVDTHVTTCEECAQSLAATQRMDRALAGLDQPVPDASLRDTFYRESGWTNSQTTEEHGRFRHLPTVLSAAAAVVAVVVLVGVLNVLLRGAPERTTQSGQPSPTTEAWDSTGLILTVPPYSAGEVTLAAARSDRSTGSVRPGQRLRLRLLWSYTGQVARSLATFVHMTDFNDTVIAQSEREIVFSPDVASKTTIHEITIPDDPEGTYYQLRAGLTDTETGERLTFTNPESGERTSSISLDTLFVWQPERVPVDMSLTETYANQRLGYAIDYPPGWRVRESSGTSDIVSIYSYPLEEAPQRGGDFSPDQTKIEIVPMISRDRVAPSLETMVSRVENDDKIEVLWKEEWELSDGIQAVRMQITGTLTGKNALLLTVINDTSLHIQGYGDLFPFDDIVRTLRPIERDSTPTPASTETPVADPTNVSSTNTPPAQTPTPEIAIVATPVWSTRVSIQDAIVQLNQAGCNEDMEAYEVLLDPAAPADWRENRIEAFRSNPTCPENRTDIERIGVNGDWAMAAVRIDNGAYVLRYFRRGDNGLWKLTAPVAEPWGEMRTLRTDLVQVQYYAFDDPYVQEVSTTLDAFMQQVADDIGIAIDASQPIVIHVVPAEHGRLDLLTGTPPPITISPLSVPGLINGVTTTSPTDALHRAMFETITVHLIRSTFLERYDEELPRFVEGILYWEVLRERGEYSHERALESIADPSTRQPVSTLLDPQDTEPKIQQVLALVTFITETYGRDSLGPLVEAGFQADDWKIVVTQALNESPEEFNQRWDEWIQDNQ